MAVTIDDLKALYVATPALTDDQYQMALDTAEMVVNEDLKPKCPMSEERYDKITLYLAAHFAELNAIVGLGGGVSGAVTRSKLGEADESYAAPAEGSWGYNSSRWGQMAIALDQCGILAGTQANQGLKAQLRVV